ncbi:MAG: hypothetical protein IJ821_01305 [Lachnospiraceae bacterium]|nr:hypothetical protein [Lachnospiraceae bacterium]
MAKSIIQAYTKQYNRECFLCRFEAEKDGKYYEPSERERKSMHKHHFMHGSANRKLAEQYGLWGYLCENHHSMLHEKSKYYEFLIQVAQGRFEKLYSHEKWMEIFKKNYLIF